MLAQPAAYLLAAMSVYIDMPFWAERLQLQEQPCACIAACSDDIPMPTGATLMPLDAGRRLAACWMLYVFCMNRLKTAHWLRQYLICKQLSARSRACSADTALPRGASHNPFHAGKGLPASGKFASGYLNVHTQAIVVIFDKPLLLANMTFSMHQSQTRRHASAQKGPHTCPLMLASA